MSALPGIGVMDETQHRAGRFALQLVTPAKLVGRHRLETDQDGFPVDHARSDLGVADMTVLQHQAVGTDGKPELFVVHRLEPAFHIVNVSKLFHPAIVSNRSDEMQICPAKGGSS